MSDDIARLGFSVDTAGLKKGEKGLKTLSTQGKNTEKRIGTLESSFKSFGRNASAAVASVDGPLGGISSRISSLTTVATTGGFAITALAVGMAAFTAAISKGVSELDDLQVSLAKTSALLKATGYASGFTGEQLASQAQSVALSTLASVEEIGAAQSVLLTFKSITGDVFSETIGLAQDMATVFGGDAKSSATQLGKALQDPILGISALTRVGVTFTTGQKDMIKSLVESGDKLNAQRVILKELKSEFGGVGEAVAKSTLSGSIDTLGQNFDNLTVRLASNIDALDTFKYVVDRIGKGMAKTTDQLAPDTAGELFDKTLDLQWKANGIADEMEGLADGRRKRRLQGELDATNTALEASKAATKETAEQENEIITKRGDALRASLETQKEEREKAAAEAAKAASSVSSAVTIKPYDASDSMVNDSGLASSIADITGSTTIGQIEGLNNQLELTKELLEMGLIPDDIGAQAIQNLTDELDGLNGKTVSVKSSFDDTTSSVKDALSSMQDMTSSGSKGFQALGVAVDAANALQAVNAVLTQASGDPYTAFARMTAMAATVSALGQSIGSIGGGLDSTFEDKQSTQSLNEWGDQADAISSSTEDTADYLNDLVGINTDMLDALVNLQTSIEAASGIAQKDVSSSSISYSSNVVDNIFDSITDTALGKFAGLASSAFNLVTFGMGNVVMDWIGGALGGSSKTTDTGIQVIGGTIADLIDGASVYAYEEVKSKKYAWSSSKKNTYTSYLEDASTQFSLVFASLADSVYEAGSVLGFTSEYLTDAINDFVIDTSEISLEDMSSDEITEALEAYFSNVFSNLAESVVYYLDEFQDTGEELGETLTRLAAEVTLLEYASENLGVSLGNLTDDSYSLVSAADGLADLLGGTENFSDYLSSFITNFASDSQMLSMYSDTLTESLSDVGLSLPGTSSAMWELMSTLDASTDSGLEQIATLLELSDTASEYYDLLEDTQGSMADLSDTFAGAVMDIYDVSDAVSQISLDAALAAAQLGDFSLAEALDTSDYTLDTGDFASLADYNIAQAEVANKLLELSELSAAEAGDVETEQLDELKAINASIIASITETNGLLRMQNKYQATSSEYLDTINNKTEYAA